ncbi:MAG: exodeoxyribonuclease VII small subunit [Pyrinomonas sp.]|uniref:exodeoxyribonuclease VII small subunit n=1 Tax=Pyrinomonas sp. TaxID=2080306 RepID=UPI003319E425
MGEGKKEVDFETALAQLEQIVRELERGDLPLEKSLELFERGVRLSRECQERLNEAERRIEMLLQDADGRVFTSDFGEAEDGFGEDDEQEPDGEEIPF